MKAVIQSFKKVLFYFPASIGSGFTNNLIVNGVDSIAAGQLSATDVQVPTGSILKYFEIQFAANNPTGVPIYLNCTIQYKDAGQSFIDPNAVGGNAQRNQVLHMDYFSVGQNQNSTHKFKFKVPSKFQRVRESRQWALVWSSSGTINFSMQMIYKFYR